MPDKRIFKIGQLVEVNLNNQAEAHYEKEGKRRVKKKIDWLGYKFETSEMTLARITGVKQLWEGQYERGSSGPMYGYGGHYEDYEEPYCSQDTEVIVWCVRLGYRNKELYFFAEDIKRLDFIGMGDDIPYFWNGGWSKEIRAKMSRESKDWPRDEKGRWKR